MIAQMRHSMLSGTRPCAQPRPLIAASWHRANSLGLDPDRNSPSELLAAEELERRRRASGLAGVLPVLRSGLSDIADEAGHLMVVADRDGRVLWRGGSSAIRRRADDLGFTDGADWGETVVGTNAIGTALAARKPVQVFATEHYVHTHHVWTCAAAPLHSPRDGRLLGVVDVSGPAETVHPTTLALVDAVAQLAEARLRIRHLADLDRLRSFALPILARVGGQTLVTDEHGWIAASTGLPPGSRLVLPTMLGAGRTWLPTHGACDVEPLPGGWLIRVIDPESEEGCSRAVLDVSTTASPTLTRTGLGDTWTYPLSPRHAEILYLIAEHPEGLTARQLAVELFADPERIVTVRAEISRMRRTLTGVLTSQPYRFADGIDVTVKRPPDGTAALPYSTAPGIRMASTGTSGSPAAPGL